MNKTILSWFLAVAALVFILCFGVWAGPKINDLENNSHYHTYLLTYVDGETEEITGFCSFERWSNRFRCWREEGWNEVIFFYATPSKVEVLK